MAIAEAQKWRCMVVFCQHESTILLVLCGHTRVPVPVKMQTGTSYAHINRVGVIEGCWHQRFIMLTQHSYVFLFRHQVYTVVPYSIPQRGIGAELKLLYAHIVAPLFFLAFFLSIRPWKQLQHHDSWILWMTICSRILLYMLLPIH